MGRKLKGAYTVGHKKTTPRLPSQFACAYNSTSTGTVNGPDSTEGATNYMAWVGPDPAQYLPFTGDLGDGGDSNIFLFFWLVVSCHPNSPAMNLFKRLENAIGI